MKKSLVAVLCAALLLTGCNKGEPSSQPTELVVSSQAGGETALAAFPVQVRGVTVESAAQRVVSLSPAVTEILSELGFAGKLVGVSSYCDYPEGIDKPAFGSAENPDLSGITALIGRAHV